MSCPYHCLRLYRPNNIKLRFKSYEASHYVVLFQPPFTSYILGPNILLSTLFSEILNQYSSSDKGSDFQTLYNDGPSA